MKTKVYILVLVAVLVSCDRTKPSQSFYSRQEDSLFYQVVDTLIQPDSVYKRQALLVLSGILDNTPYAKQKQIMDSLKLFFDTAQLYVAVPKKLIRYSHIIDIQYVRKNPEYYFKYVVRSTDSSLLDVFNKFLSDRKLRARRIDNKVIQTQLAYRIIQADTHDTVRIPKPLIAETHIWSRVTFNDHFDKACFYDQVTLGTGSIEDYIILLERKDSHWRIIARRSF
jgi:hypothetical protein